MIRTALLLALLPGAALAHTGIGAHGSPFVSGLTHPIFGPDHLLAMVAVGIFAAMSGGTARFAFPGAFIGGMILGGALGYGGAELPIIEPTILASVIVLGAVIAAAFRPPLALACAAIALFGLAHGYAHGLEGPALGGIAYGIGFVISTAALHAAGLMIGLAAGNTGHPAVARVLGGLTCLAGIGLAIG